MKPLGSDSFILKIKEDLQTKRLEVLSNDINKWFKSERFASIERPYTAAQIAPLRNSIPLSTISHYLSKKLWNLLNDAKQTYNPLLTFGALDPVQAANLVKHFKTIYVSGWQCSSTASSTNEPGPDFADYPANTVPLKVDQLIQGLLLQDRQQNGERAAMTLEQRITKPPIDFLAPIIADGDACFGGPTSAMKLVKMMIEAGAAGIHIEDQRPGNKQCGHMGGKVIVSMREHIQRLVACRLQADIMGSELVIIARTDALSAKLIDSNIDPVDQKYILGECQDGQLRTYKDAGILDISKLNQLTNDEQAWTTKNWINLLQNNRGGLKEAINIAQSLGFQLNYDWQACRTSEGFYQINGCIELCDDRAQEYFKYSDMLWMETPTPDIKVATKFSELVRMHHPTKFLAYNLSPSFNWSGFGLSDQEIKNFSLELGKLGYVWQFITLAGFHLNALKSEKFVRAFAENNMLGYVETIQRKEEKHKIDQLTHQQWSGANYIDSLLLLINNDSQVLATSEESTEHQFSSSGLTNSENTQKSQNNETINEWLQKSKL